MEQKYVNKNVRIIQNNGKITYGKILYWIEEMGERPYILINNQCIYVDEIKSIEEVTE